ncbi:MAG: hypothetical protein LBB76_06260 [Azoarcus sp.]|nr:hypothetical protein [Azoarcus sp.]
MNTQHLVIVQGDRNDGVLSRDMSCAGHAVADAIHAGFRVGQTVRIGRVAGCVVGYNIGHFGQFSGEDYPLLVRTPYGVAKCSLLEVAAA